MTPFTKEQIEALAERIEARAECALAAAKLLKDAGLPVNDLFTRINTLSELARELRDGTFIEVQHD